MHNEAVKRKQYQCPFCKEIIANAYIELNPFPEIPCPYCGSLMEYSSIIKEEITSQNERKAERCNVSLKVTYNSLDNFLTEYTQNVSNRGIFIKTKTPYEIGSDIDLLLYVPGLNEPIRIIGRVIHNNFFSINDENAGIGIEFVDIDAKSRERLIRFLRTQKD
ncbi:MAG: PilZ domain-containing protein [Nitrospirota bacterium]